jgi:actin-related protein
VIQKCRKDLLFERKYSRKKDRIAKAESDNRLTHCQKIDFNHEIFAKVTSCSCKKDTGLPTRYVNVNYPKEFKKTRKSRRIQETFNKNNLSNRSTLIFQKEEIVKGHIKSELIDEVINLLMKLLLLSTLEYVR